MIKMKRTRAATQFWLWFERLNKKYLYLQCVRTKKEFAFWFDELQMHAMAHCKVLAADLSFPSEGKGQLIITTNGKPLGFRKAEQLVQRAPTLENWKITALRQPMPLHELAEWVGPKVDIELAKIWFQPGQPDITGICAITAYVEYILPGKEWDVHEHIMLLIEKLLGEKSAALNIHLLEVDSRCNASKKQQLLPLAELPAFVSNHSGGLKIGSDGRLERIINEP